MSQPVEKPPTIILSSNRSRGSSAKYNDSSLHPFHADRGFLLDPFEPAYLACIRG